MCFTGAGVGGSIGDCNIDAGYDVGVFAVAIRIVGAVVFVVAVVIEYIYMMIFVILLSFDVLLLSMA